jgi:hypothetical protein
VRSPAVCSSRWHKRRHFISFSLLLEGEKECFGIVPFVQSGHSFLLWILLSKNVQPIGPTMQSSGVHSSSFYALIVFICSRHTCTHCLGFFEIQRHVPSWGKGLALISYGRSSSCYESRSKRGPWWFFVFNLEVPRISPWRKPPTALYDHVRDYYCMERNGRKLYRETGPIAARSSKTRGYLVLASTCNKSQTLSAPLSISLFLKKFFLRHAPNPPRWYESNVPGDDGLLRVFLYKEQTAKRTERVFLSRFCFALKEFLFFLSRVSRRGAKITTFSCRNETKSERTPKISIGFSFCRSQVIGGMTINFRQV